MNFEQWLDALNLNLEITRYANQNNRYCASIKGVEFKDCLGDGILQSLHGNGPYPRAAIFEFMSHIQGKVVVLDAFTDKRRTFDVPKELEYTS